MPDSSQQPPEVLQQGRRSRRARMVAGAVVLALVVLVAAGSRFVWQTRSEPAPIVVALIDSMSGPDAASGIEARAATQLYFNQVNAAGGIDGRRLELEAYDDQSKPATAATKAGWILDSAAVAVLGHSGNDTAMAAGPVYRDGRIAAVTGTATADALTRDNRYYFRAASPNSAQAAFLAQYIHAVILRHTSGLFRAPDIDLAGGPGAFSESFLAGFQQDDSGSKPRTFMLQPGSDLTAPARALAEQLAQEPEPRIIVLGFTADAAAATLKAIRRRGIRSMVILPSSAASDAFVRQFAAEPEEQDEPGFFTDNLFAIAPVILDNTGLFGQGLASGYQAGTGGMRAGWYAAGAQNAARVLVEAIRRAHIGDSAATKQADREKIRDTLAGIDTPGHAVPGIDGTLYFNAAHEMPRPMQYGYFHAGHFVSAPLQLVPVTDRDLVDIDHEIALGHMVQVGEQFFWLQRVVATGIDIAHLNRVDTKEGSFNADFYFWIRYAHGDDLPSKIEFSDFSGAFDAAHPLKSSVEDGIDYRLWRVSGTFKANFNLHDYPFDTQALVIRLRNRDHPREQIAYDIDTFGLGLDGSGQATGSDAFQDLQLWRVVTVRPFVSSYSIQSTLGEPALFGTSNRTEYGGFAMAVVVQRNVIAFMVKALLPLFLLMLVVFATLFFPPSMAKERLTIPVTGILTSAVLLISITNQLPPLGYTVALEYLFYIFFALCLMAMVTGLLSETLRNKTFHRHVIRVDMFGRVAYVAIVAVTAALYLWKYGATMV